MQAAEHDYMMTQDALQQKDREAAAARSESERGDRARGRPSIYYVGLRTCTVPVVGYQLVLY